MHLGLSIVAGSSGSDSASLTRTAYVASTGDDMTGTINNPALPYATLNAAAVALVSAYPIGQLTFIIVDDYGQTTEDFSEAVNRTGLVTIKAASGTITMGSGLMLSLGEAVVNLSVRNIEGITLHWLDHEDPNEHLVGVVESNCDLALVCRGKDVEGKPGTPAKSGDVTGANGTGVADKNGATANASGAGGEYATTSGGFGRSITLKGLAVFDLDQRGGSGGNGGDGGDAGNATGGNGWDASGLINTEHGGDAGSAIANGGDGGNGLNGGNGGDVTLLNGATLGTHQNSGGAGGTAGNGGDPGTATAGSPGAGSNGGGDDGNGGTYPPGNPGNPGTATANAGASGNAGTAGNDGRIF